MGPNDDYDFREMAANGITIPQFRMPYSDWGGNGSDQYNSFEPFGGAASGLTLYQSITSNAPSALTDLNTFNLNLTATSGYPVLLYVDTSSTSSATLTPITGGYEIVPNGVGTLNLMAYQLGDSNWGFALLPIAILVTAISQKITATPSGTISATEGSSFDLLLSSTSGETVTLSTYSGTATLSAISGGYSVTPTSTGTLQLVASVPGDTTEYASDTLLITVAVSASGGGSGTGTGGTTGTELQTITIGATEHTSGGNLYANTSGCYVTITATSNSGLPVTLSIISGSGATLSGGTLTDTTAETVIIQATAPGDSTWAATTSANGTIAHASYTFKAVPTGGTGTGTGTGNTGNGQDP